MLARLGTSLAAGCTGSNDETPTDGTTPTAPERRRLTGQNRLRRAVSTSVGGRTDSLSSQCPRLRPYLEELVAGLDDAMDTGVGRLRPPFPLRRPVPAGTAASAPRPPIVPYHCRDRLVLAHPGVCCYNHRYKPAPRSVGLNDVQTVAQSVARDWQEFKCRYRFAKCSGRSATERLAEVKSAEACG